MVEAARELLLYSASAVGKRPPKAPIIKQHSL